MGRTFIIWKKNGKRTMYHSKYNNEDLAQEDAYNNNPDAEYIESY